MRKIYIMVAVSIAIILLGLFIAPSNAEGTKKVSDDHSKVHPSVTDPSVCSMRAWQVTHTNFDRSHLKAKIYVHTSKIGKKTYWPTSAKPTSRIGWYVPISTDVLQIPSGYKQLKTVKVSNRSRIIPKFDRRGNTCQIVGTLGRTKITKPSFR